MLLLTLLLVPLPFRFLLFLHELSERPHVELQTSPRARSRQRRFISMNCPANSRETRCCRHPLVVDFEEMSWDWIIAPKRYHAFFCSGECPLSFLPQYPHTYVVGQSREHGLACCSPTKVSDITLIYFDQNYNVLYGRLPGMVLVACGCS